MTIKKNAINISIGMILLASVHITNYCYHHFPGTAVLSGSAQLSADHLALAEWWIWTTLSLLR